jgi:hypothetical protein
MKYQVYVKKKINSEADLPKEKGIYIVKAADNDTPEFMKMAERGNLFWNKVAWYLQPIELDLPEDKEITAEFTNEHYTYDIGRHLRVNKDRIFGAKTIRDKIENQLK